MSDKTLQLRTRTVTGHFEIKPMQLTQIAKAEGMSIMSQMIYDQAQAILEGKQNGLLLIASPQDKLQSVMYLLQMMADGNEAFVLETFGQVCADCGHELPKGAYVQYDVDFEKSTVKYAYDKEV